MNNAQFILSNSEFQIREFLYPQDYPAVIHLWQNAGSGIHIRRSDEPEEILKKLQRDPELFLVADYAGEIIGSVIGGFDGRRGMMYHLAVSDPFRHHGIASALTNKLEERLHQLGCIRYYLLVTKDNAPAIQFYEANGWDKLDLHIYAKDI